MSVRLLLQRSVYVFGVCGHRLSPRCIDSKISNVPPISGFVDLRYYSKSKDKGKTKKKGGKVHIDDNQLAEVIDLEELKSILQSSVDKLEEDYAKHITLTTGIAAFESISVKFENKDYELQELAEVVRKNPKTIILNMAVFPQAIPAVLKAIQISGLNVNPQQDGTSLFVPIPKVTTEHRERLQKNARALYIKCRDHLKEIHISLIKDLNKKEHVSEDTIYNVKQQINTLVEIYLDKAKLLNRTKGIEVMKKDL